jgi:hypothetical protein
MHRSKLQHHKLLSLPAHAPLPVQHRTRRGQTNGDADHEKQWQERDQQQARSDDV